MAALTHMVAANAATPTARDEVVHTTANHAWLTADHGWLPASFLRLGEPVRRADGTTATVVAMRAVPGAAAMWDLTVGDLHDFAVGAGAYVVHNCGQGGNPDPNKLGSGQNRYYEGQRREGLQRQGYRQNRGLYRARPNSSQAFRDFIGSRRGAGYVFDDDKWTYHMEKWERGGAQVENHYWYNADEGEFWHHH